MHQVFDHCDFYTMLDSDLRQARYLVIIQSPFMTLRRVNFLKSVLVECIARGVRICVFTQKIDRGLSSKDEFTARISVLKQVTDKLFSFGVHVTTVPKIHEKLVVIDERIFWEGSLNPLSYRDTSERMTRWESSLKVRKVMDKHELFKCSKCRESSMQGSILSVFGNIIRRRRKMLKMSQFEFSEISGIGQSEISRIERGEVDCRLSTISHLLSMLKMNCRPLLWHMVPSVEQELNVLFAKQYSAEELDLEQGS